MLVIKRYSNVAKTKSGKDIGCFGSSSTELFKSESCLQNYTTLKKFQLGKYEKNAGFLKYLLRCGLVIIATGFGIWFLIETLKNINFFQHEKYFAHVGTLCCLRKTFLHSGENLTGKRRIVRMIFLNG